MKAFKLINTINQLSVFQEGILPDNISIDARYFFFKTQIENYERSVHRAPRYQFVVTLKGKLKFTVSDGTSFTIEPGIILIAKDVEGAGHTWELLEGETWERMYIVPSTDTDDHFQASEKRNSAE